MLIFCPQCNNALPDYLLPQKQSDSDCPTCGAHLGITMFPALFRTAARIDPHSLVIAEGDASCFEHPNKRAVAVCNKCGRFLCALCEVTVAGEIWCPSCLVPTKASGPIQALVKRRTLFDSIALALATFPAMLIYPALITGPLTVYLCLRHWKEPSSIIPRGKGRMILALLFGVTQVGVIIFIFLGMLILSAGHNAGGA